MFKNVNLRFTVGTIQGVTVLGFLFVITLVSVMTGRYHQRLDALEQGYEKPS